MWNNIFRIIIISIIALCIVHFQGSKPIKKTEIPISNHVSDTKDIIWSKNWCDSKVYQDIDTSSCVASDYQFIQNNNGIIWVRNNNDINVFAKQLSESSHHFSDFVLVTSDGDMPIPDHLQDEVYNTIINHPLCKAWYAQNATTTNTILHHLPIGMDFHTIRDPFTSSQQMINFISRLASFPRKKTCKIYCDVHTVKGRSDIRDKLIDKLDQLEHIIYSEKRQDLKTTWKNYSKYKYVLSLPGAGLDCHRTWEALALGATVITVHSPLDTLLSNYKVIILDRLERLNDMYLLDTMFETVKYKSCSVSKEEWLRKITSHLY